MFFSPQLVCIGFGGSYCQGAWQCSITFCGRLLQKRSWRSTKSGLPQFPFAEGKSCLHQGLQSARPKTKERFLPEGLSFTFKTHSWPLSVDMWLPQQISVRFFHDDHWRKSIYVVWSGNDQIWRYIQSSHYLRCVLPGQGTPSKRINRKCGKFSHMGVCGYSHFRTYFSFFSLFRMPWYYQNFG